MSGSLYEAIREASEHRDPMVLRTPLQRSEGLSRLLDCDVLLKAEHLQTTGSFKFRGASNKIRLLSANDRRRGVVTASTGNHGHGVALASRNAGVPATVYAARKTSPSKLSAIAAQGADLRLVDGPELEAGFIHDVPETETISDGTAGALEPGAVTLPICAKVIGSHVTVSEDLIRSAMWALAEHERWMVEGAAGVALAGLAALREEMRGRTVAVVLCGRNIQTETFVSALSGLSAATASERLANASAGMVAKTS